MVTSALIIFFFCDMNLSEAHKKLCLWASFVIPGDEIHQFQIIKLNVFNHKEVLTNLIETLVSKVFS